MSGTDLAADVPGKFDVIIDGYGYVTSRAVDPNFPFRTQQVQLSYTQTFVERTNVSGSYGDNQQDFWLAISQKDWSLGEQLKFFRTDQTSRYWRGQNVDVRTPGQVTIRPAVKAVTFAGAVVTCCPKGTQSGSLFASSATNLYEIDSTGTITDKGAHGLGVAPATFGLVTDGLNAYLSALTGGSVGV